MPSFVRNSLKPRTQSGDLYWNLARSPLHCLIFLLPLLAVYEFGVLWVGGSRGYSLRNGADYWMRAWLQEQGWQGHWLLPVLVVGVLLTWQIGGRFSWKVRWDTLIGMMGESLLFACVLILFGQMQDAFFQQYIDPPRLTLPITAAMGNQMARTVSYVGAGIYEEVLFRLLALPVMYVGLRLLLLPDRWSTVVAVLLTSLLFAMAHHIGPGAEPFRYFSFVFRTCAGLFFAILFVLRGFGVTVGTHAAYDILVGVLLRADF